MVKPPPSQYQLMAERRKLRVVPRIGQTVQVGRARGTVAKPDPKRADSLMVLFDGTLAPIAVDPVQNVIYV